MRHLPWQCFAIILLACLLIQATSARKKPKINKIAKHNKHSHKQTKVKNNNSPVRPNWNESKGPKKASAVSQEKIPRPNKNDKQELLRELHSEGYATEKRHHMSNTGHLGAPTPERKREGYHDVPANRKMYKQDEEALRSDRTIEGHSRHLQDPNFAVEKDDIETHAPKDRELISKSKTDLRNLNSETVMRKSGNSVRYLDATERTILNDHNHDNKVTASVNAKESPIGKALGKSDADHTFDVDTENVQPPAPVGRSLTDTLPKKQPVMQYIKTPEEREAEEEYIFHKWYLDKDVKVETRGMDSKKHKPKYPKIFGLDLDNLGRDHPHRFMRNGSATFTDSCDNVRKIEKWMRLDEPLYIGINPFYVKFTEAYGIFIIGSANVTDNGLMRACYTLKIMLSSRYDLRNAYYKLFGRIALIGDGEEQTSLYEYSEWDSSYWDKRARGLGPTISIPLTSAGDDNQRCKSGDRYFDQDIFVHEMAHAVHLLGATYVVPGFQKRLTDVYERNVKEKGKWKETYAATNLNEYFSVATQFYMNAFRGTSYMKLGVTDRDTLAEYDPDVYKLLQELYPCVGRHNQLIHRCSWKYCSLKNFQLKYNGTMYRTNSDCPVLKYNGRKFTADQCAQYACYYLGNAFKYEYPNCYVLNCPDTSTFKGLMIDQGYYSYDIYVSLTSPHMDLKREKLQKVTQLCVKGPLMPDKCKEVTNEERIKCGDLSREHCEDVGCCFDKDERTCYFPKQDCVDRYLDCYQYAQLGDCERNPIGMYQKCPFACNVCKKLDKLASDDWKSGCQDKALYCAEWASHGECTRNPAYMTRYCQLSCTKCKPVNPLTNG